MIGGRQEAIGEFPGLFLRQIEWEHLWARAFIVGFWEKSTASRRSRLRIGCAVLCSVTQLCPTLCDPRGAHQAPLSLEILQARILEWVAIPSSRIFSQPRDRTQGSRIAGKFFTQNSILVLNFFRPREQNLLRSDAIFKFMSSWYLLSHTVYQTSAKWFHEYETNF